MSVEAKRGRKPKYKPEHHCQWVIELMSTGKTLPACAGPFGVSVDAIYDWQKQYPEFSEACAIGKAKLLEYWENRLIAGSKDRNCNQFLIASALKRCSKKWREALSAGASTGPAAAVTINLLDDPIKAAAGLAFILDGGSEVLDAEFKQLPAPAPAEAAKPEAPKAPNIFDE